jgi:hypothetical protein
MSDSSYQGCQVQLKQITIKEAVELITDIPSKTVFYTYKIGDAIHKLNQEMLATAIKGGAIYFTPESYVETNEDPKRNEKFLIHKLLNILITVSKEYKFAKDILPAGNATYEKIMENIQNTEEYLGISD